MIRFSFLITVIFFLFTFPCNGAETRTIQWNDLVPKLPEQENPLAGLSEEQVGFVEWIIYLREFLPEKVTPADQEFYDEMNRAMPLLKKKGIDVDAIIEQRRKRNSTLNMELDGQTVRLAGYLLPLDLSGNKITDFLLVPTVGACIHVPPPPLNQIVHAVSATPTPYEIDRLFIPVSVTGILKAKSTSKELFLVDGSAEVDIGYSMVVEKIEDYKR